MSTKNTVVYSNLYSSDDDEEIETVNLNSDSENIDEENDDKPVKITKTAPVKVKSVKGENSKTTTSKSSPRRKKASKSNSEDEIIKETAEKVKKPSKTSSKPSTKKPKKSGDTESVKSLIMDDEDIIPPTKKIKAGIKDKPAAEFKKCEIVKKNIKPKKEILDNTKPKKISNPKKAKEVENIDPEVLSEYRDLLMNQLFVKRDDVDEKEITLVDDEIDEKERKKFAKLFQAKPNYEIEDFFKYFTSGIIDTVNILKHNSIKEHVSPCFGFSTINSCTYPKKVQLNIPAYIKCIQNICRTKIVNCFLARENWTNSIPSEIKEKCWKDSLQNIEEAKLDFDEEDIVYEFDDKTMKIVNKYKQSQKKGFGGKTNGDKVSEAEMEIVNDYYTKLRETVIVIFSHLLNSIYIKDLFINCAKPNPIFNNLFTKFLKNEDIIHVLTNPDNGLLDNELYPISWLFAPTEFEYPAEKDKELKYVLTIKNDPEIYNPNSGFWIKKLLERKETENKMDDQNEIDQEENEE